MAVVVAGEKVCEADLAWETFGIIVRSGVCGGDDMPLVV